MKYDFPADIQDRLTALIGEGVFASEDEAIRQAIDALEQLEAEKIARWHERNRLSNEQSEQGLIRPLDDERVLSRLRARLAKDGIFD